ncbi:hypothetical protein BpHYR1_041939 [Brachionus plicatilis]|uniref:Uncharacterized protein n=1 Tax=Brachionus plicatilis TaxID=10195 RepID=A0A3M7QUZ7_BRAPC|nr:hypothetical protein BpHYR1_041939 [Brachionus plicatilis]
MSAFSLFFFNNYVVYFISNYRNLDEEKNRGAAVQNSGRQAKKKKFLSQKFVNSGNLNFKWWFSRCISCYNLQDILGNLATIPLINFRGDKEKTKKKLLQDISNLEYGLN